MKDITSINDLPATVVRIDPTVTGWRVWEPGDNIPPMPGPSLDTIKASACTDIDAEAERRRNLVLTPGSGQMAAYQEKERQARLLLADPNPDAATYPDIYNEVGITADTVHEVAAAVLEAAGQWRAYGRMVEKARLSGKKAVAQATDLAGILAARDGVSWP